MTAGGTRRLDGVQAVITAGGTREPIDPVRFLGNRSSGRMGNALAAACREAGATVELITAARPPAAAPGMSVTRVDTAVEMHAAVWAALERADLLLMAAAVADYRPRQVAARKLKKSASRLTLELVPDRRHPGVAARPPAPLPGAGGRLRRRDRRPARQRRREAAPQGPRPHRPQ